MLFTLLSSLSLLLLVAAKEGKGYGHGGNHQHQHHNHDSESCSSEGPHREQVQLVPNGLFYEFEFGEAGTFAYQNFVFYNQQPSVVQVFDCFCGGDRFAIFDNGEWIATADEGCDDAVANCNPYSSDPQYCFNQGAMVQGWCRIAGDGAVINGLGQHNITIQVLVNYYRTGKGYIFLQPYNGPQ